MFSLEARLARPNSRTSTLGSSFPASRRSLKKSAFRMDVPEFLDTFERSQRKMAVDLAGGMSTTECRQEVRSERGRISQFRRELKDLFDVFFAD